METKNIARAYGFIYAKEIMIFSYWTQNGNL